MKPFWQNGIAQLHHADARDIPIEDQSVHCVVTSPPYWGLRSYGLDTGIGLEPTLAEHLDNIVAVGREVWRVLRDDGSFWLNYGDAYAASNPQWDSNGKGLDGRPRGGSVGMEGKRSPASGLRAKNLMGLPWRIASALQEAGAADVREMHAIERAQDAIVSAYDHDYDLIPDRVLVALERLHAEYAEAKGDSWYLRSAIVWHKPNPMPESVRDRPTSAYEMVFLLTKQPRYFMDMEAIRDKPANRLNGLIPGRTVASPKGADVNDMRSTWKRTRTSEEQAAMGSNARNVWTIPTQGRPDAHFATFPDELPRRCILAGTSEHGVCAECGAPWERVVEREVVKNRPSAGNDPRSRNADKLSSARGHGGHQGNNLLTKTQTTGWQPTCDHDAATVPATVLDPFIGSGTTCAVAQSLGRHSVGLDLNREYLAIAQRRIEKVNLPMALA